MSDANTNTSPAPATTPAPAPAAATEPAGANGAGTNETPAPEAAPGETKPPESASLIDSPKADGTAPAEQKEPEAASLIEGFGEKKPEPGTEKEPAETETKKAEPQGDFKVEIKLPPGTEVQDMKALENFQALMQEKAQEIGLNSEQASKLASDLAVWQLDANAKAEATMLHEYQERAVAMTQEWESEVRKDPELGGDKFTESATVARRGFREFGSGDLGKLLIELSGGEEAWKAGRAADLTRHPAVFRHFHKLGSMLGEDSSAGAPAGETGALSPEEELKKIYNHPTSEQLRKKLAGG